MTYPDNTTALQSVGFFTEDSREAAKVRERLAAIGMQWFNQCQSERTKYERQWALNYAFYSGNQHVQFRQTTGGDRFDLYTPKAPYYRVRIVVNQIRRIVRKEISRLTAQKPNAFIIPASAEDIDVFAAQAGEQIWDALWRRLKFNKTIREAAFWQTVCGTSYIKSYWDPTKEDPDYEPIIDPQMAPGDFNLNMQLAPSGDICIEDINPYHIFVPDLMATDIEDEPYVIHAQVKNNSWIKQTFGIDSSSSNLDSVDQDLQTVMGVQRNDSKKNQSVILEIWVKPGYLPELPKGGVFTIVADQVVQGFDEWPYEHGQYPFTKLDSIPTGKFYSASIIEDLIPIQKELNRTRSQLIEAKNRMSKPQLTAQKGSVDAKKITSEPGQVIFYNMGFDPPQPLPLQSLPSYVTEEIDRLYTDLSDLSGQHEVSNGSTPPGVTAATAISFLQEQDESLIAPHYSSIEEGIEKVAGQALNYVKMYWDENRTIKIVGLDGSFDVQAFKGADLRGNTDIRVESGSALPTSRAAKQAFLMDLMKMGFIPADEGLEMMELGSLNRIYERIQIDKRQAQRENLKMRVITEEDVQAHNEAWNAQNPEMTRDIDSGAKLDPPPIISINTYDNHAIHIEIHNQYRKSQNFENASPIVKATFEEHVRQHMEAQAGLMVHPLTGMEPSNPNAPDPDEEQDMADQMDQENSGASTGPVPMPQLEGESS